MGQRSSLTIGWPPLLMAALVLSACGGSSGPVDGGKAYAHLQAMVGFGPRPFGSDALAKTADYIGGELGKNMQSAGIAGYVGEATGYVLKFSNGLVAYLSGDTGITGEQEKVVRGHYAARLAVMPLAALSLASAMPCMEASFSSASPWKSFCQTGSISAEYLICTSLLAR